MGRSHEAGSILRRSARASYPPAQRAGKQKDYPALCLQRHRQDGLSMAFKDMGKQDDARDTLYFNAFTEDLFHWNNDLAGDADRRLLLNKDSRFFQGLFDLEMDNRIRPLLRRYADFDFRIDTEGPEWAVRFSRLVDGQPVDNIKVSSGEENIFIWCFFWLWSNWRWTPISRRTNG